MKIIGKTSLVSILVACIIALVASAESAKAEVEGEVLVLFADPSDFVFLMDKNGHCGSAFFHVKRTNTNFKEVVALLITALSTRKSVHAVDTTCEGTRNVITHAWIIR